MWFLLLITFFLGGLVGIVLASLCAMNKRASGSDNLKEASLAGETELFPGCSSSYSWPGVICHRARVQ
jgi:hypothetical protein